MTDQTSSRRIMGPRGAHARRKGRRRGVLISSGAVIVVGAVAVGVTMFAGGSGSPPTTTTTTVPPSIATSVSSFKLTAPISREVVLATPQGSELAIFGGLTSGNVQAQGIFTLDTSTGTLTHVGNLISSTSEGAGALVGANYVIFGGLSPSASAIVQAFPAVASAGSPSTTTTAAKSKASRSSVLAAAQTGSLPQPRTDEAVVTVGATTYIVGGWDGSSADPDVLATSDGVTFRKVARLTVGVRNAAVAALGHDLYVFGGEFVSGNGNTGAVLNDIQKVDLSKHTCRVVGHLPTPLTGATSVVVGGNIYVIGGDRTPEMPPTTTIPQRRGVSTTVAPSPASPAQSSPTIYLFDRQSQKANPAGSLQVPVSYAGIEVLGTQAWIIGGESNGQISTQIQLITVSG